MIYGVGTDLVSVARIAEVWQRQGERFPEKILGADELAIFRERHERSVERGVRFLASRFAAKEAFSKALGLGFREPVRWADLQIVPGELGEPVLSYTGDLLAFMQSNQLMAHLSLSDEAGQALAFVVAEKRPR